MGKKILRDLIEKREKAVASAEAVMQRSLDEDRTDLNEAETTELTGLRSRIESFDKSIEEWTAISETEERVEATRAKIGAPDVRVGTESGGTVVTREEPVYRPDGERSFFRDMWTAREGNTEAREMLSRHSRALTTGASPDGGGIVPPKYVGDLFAPDPKYGSPVAASFPQYPLADARSFDIPRQTGAGTVGDQTDENDAVVPSDQEFDQITVSPKTKVGATVISRQLLDGSNPAIDMIVGNDLRGELLHQHEGLATATLEGTVGALTGTSSGDGDDIIDAIVAAVPSVYGARFMPADTIYVSVTTYGVMIAAKDTSGRPLLNAVNPQNAPGTGSLATLTTDVGGIPVVSSPAMTDNKIIVARRSDFAFFSSPRIDFRYEEKNGPESIEVGVWQYVAATTGRYPKGVLVITHTPA